MRRTRHRRRFHTDRIVHARRARYLRETPPRWPFARNHDDWLAKRLSYGYLADRDPWDCGRPRCGVCHYLADYQRHEQNRAWRDEWGVG